MPKPVFEPLWEDSDTFTDEKVVEYKAQAKELNRRFERLTSIFEGPTKSPFNVGSDVNF